MADQMVTVLDPNGNPGDVPAANVPAALAAGGKLGIHVYAPDGTPGYVPHDKLGDALKAGATYAPASQTQDSPSLLAPGQESGAVSRVGEFLRGAIAAPVTSLLHPINSIASMGSQAMTGSTPYGTPFIAPTGNKTRDEANQNMIQNNQNQVLNQTNDAIMNHPAYTAGGAISMALLGKGLGSLAEGTPTNITPEYGAARSIAKAVLPKDAEFNSYVDALQKEKGNVEQYAAQNGLTTRTPLDMSVAAGKSADALGDFYRSNILGPNADQQVPVPPRFDQVGSQAPSGSRYASLGDIDKRIGELNDIIRPARLNATQGATATDLNNLRDVVAEHDALVNILHNKLGAATNLDPSVIAGVRQSLGARNQLADQTLAGANRTTLQEGRIDRGVSTVKTPSVGGLVLDAINKLRGGPEAIANRVYRNAYPKLDVPANIGNPASLDELKGSNIADYLSGRR